MGDPLYNHIENISPENAYFFSLVAMKAPIGIEHNAMSEIPSQEHCFTPRDAIAELQNRGLEVRQGWPNRKKGAAPLYRSLDCIYICVYPFFSPKQIDNDDNTKAVARRDRPHFRAILQPGRVYQPRHPL